MVKSIVHIVPCRCGQVALEAIGEPIITTVCRCEGCRMAGGILEAMPGAEPVLVDGGTPFALFRKDRVRCPEGRAALAEFRLTADTPTRRVVAVCCNTFMFLDFTKGHWISIYNGQLDITGPAVDRRSGMFAARLVWAWARMAFRSPRIDFVENRLDGYAN